MNVAEEMIMSEVLEGTADDDFSQSREIGPVNSATVEVTAETIEVTVDAVNSLTAIRVPAGTKNSRPVGFLR